jgi:hypothetical protein
VPTATGTDGRQSPVAGERYAHPVPIQPGGDDSTTLAGGSRGLDPPYNS